MMRRSASSTRPLSLLSEEKGLPMPSSSRPSPRGVARQIRRKWPLYLVLAVVSLLLIGKFSSSSSPKSPYAYSNSKTYGLSDVGEERREAVEPVKLEQPPDELLMAEDDLALQVEDPVLSPEELARATANEAETAATREAAKTEQLQSLIWFLYHGGVLPSLVPTKMSAKEWRAQLAEAWEIKKTSAGTKHAQADSYADGEMPELFPGGWEDESKLRTRVTVFSKSYCPYSRRAKVLIGGYDLDPPPFILELDHRPDDMEAIQDALYALTGRRTVPNVIVDFESVGGSDEVATLHGEGSLEKKLLRGQTKFIFNANGELESHEI